MKIEWDKNRSFVRIRFRRPTSAQLSRAVKADEISVVEPTQPLRLARQSKNKKRLGLWSQPLFACIRKIQLIGWIFSIYERPNSRLMSEMTLCFKGRG